MAEQRTPTKYFIGHVCDVAHRHKASSGGIGTMLQKHLLSTGQFDTSITFQFNAEKCMYEAKLIHTAEEVHICGSIYQDIDIARFIHDHIGEITNGIIVSCPPCQVSVIRNMLQKNGIPNFIISFCCSGQTTIEGTWKYYELLGIKKKDVVNMQYRGNGWPSGIQIWLNDGTMIFRDNYTEPWITLHASKLYQPKRCFSCTFETSYKSDISLADPWLNDYISNDKIGSTLFLVNTSQGLETIRELSQQGHIECKSLDYNSFYIAQRPNVEKKNRLLYQKGEFNFLRMLVVCPRIRTYFTKSIKQMKSFVFLNKLQKKIRYNRIAFFRKMNILNKIKSRYRYLVFSHKIGGHDGSFNVQTGVTAKNPQCVFIGKKVSIGSNTFFNAVTHYQGTHYNPVIKIGEGTSIGRNCTLSSIIRVDIGKHVLFASQVHITDHSHGYQDISLPISPQQLITKGPVIIEDDCWLGFGCEILSGVHIGKHCVVAARAVVTKDVPPYSIVAGNPARIVKQYNFNTQQWESIR